MDKKKHPEKNSGCWNDLEANSLLLDSRWLLLILLLLLFWCLRFRLLVLRWRRLPLGCGRGRVLLLRTLTGRRRLLPRRRLVPRRWGCGPIIFGPGRFRAVIWLSCWRTILRLGGSIVRLGSGRRRRVSDQAALDRESRISVHALRPHRHVLSKRRAGI